MAERNAKRTAFTGDECNPGPISNACCVDVNRVYDSCADKDCLEDLIVLFTAEDQALVDSACSIRAKSAEILTTYVKVEEVPYNRGCFSIEINYYFLVEFDVYQHTNSTTPVTIRGLSTFCKNCILFGSDGRVKVFSNENISCEEYDDVLPCSQREPVAKVQAVDPIVLSCRTVCGGNSQCISVPNAVADVFEGNLVQNAGMKTVLVTLGLFSIIQLERSIQVMIPVYDFCIPDKECSCETESPCDMFRNIEFPLDEFFPRGSSRCKTCGCDTPMNYATDDCDNTCRRN